MLLRYGALCEGCDVHVDYHTTYENRDYDIPLCPKCDDDMIRVWVGDSPHVTPESLYVEGGVVTKGKRAILNDSKDDPWDGVDGLCAEQSEEFVAKSREFTGRTPANWGERKGTIVFDRGAR
jgi:hypothetical protein